MGVTGAQNGIAQLKLFFSRMGAPVTLGQLGLKEKDIPRIADNVLRSVPGGGSLGRDGMVSVLKLCL